MRIEDFITAGQVAAYIAPNVDRQGYINKAFFTPRKKAGLDLSFIKGNGGLPVSLAPTAFDAKATFLDLPALEGFKSEMPYFKQGIHLGEKDRQDIFYGQSIGDPRLADILTRTYERAEVLYNSAAVVAERMAMQLLFPANGKPGINISANGVRYIYDYDADGTWRAANYSAITSSSAKWNVPATADPIGDIEDKKNALEAISGENITVVLMNNVTFAALCACTAVKGAFSGTGVAASPANVKAFIADNYGISVVVYNKQYKDESGVAHKFIPDGYVAFLPEGELGGMWYGTTPAEIDLAEDIEIVDTGVAIYREITKDPVNVNIYAAEIVLPSYERMNSVGLLKVY